MASASLLRVTFTPKSCVFMLNCTFTPRSPPLANLRFTPMSVFLLLKYTAGIATEKSSR